MCDKRYLINASFVGGARPNPVGACPAFEKLPVQRAPRIQLQEASAKQTKSTAERRQAARQLVRVDLRAAKGPVYQAFTLGPATPATPVPTPTKPVNDQGRPQARAAPKAKAWSAAAPRSRLRNNHRHAFASLSRMMGPCCGKL